MARRSKNQRHHLGRELSIRPRRTGYKHRDIIAVVDGVGVTEQGEVITDVCDFAYAHTGCLWVTMDPAHLLNLLVERWGEVKAFNYQLIHTTEPDPVPVTVTPPRDSDGTVVLAGNEYHPEGAQPVSGHHPPPGGARVSVEKDTRVSRFGFKCRCPAGWKCQCGAPRGRKGAMHIVWAPGDMARNPSQYLDDFTHTSLLRWAKDVRGWCEENELPILTSLSGISAALLRDARFWPNARGRVPRATNERVRAWLPGVFSELRAQPGRSHHAAIAIDQRTAYHRAAQEVPTPDPTTLYARGFYVEPETSPIWAERGTVVYERTMRQPGVVFVCYDARPIRKHEVRPPAIKPGVGRAAVWTNEVSLIESTGVHITGIVAAWTSSDVDPGLPLYGEWAQARISEASDERKRWLKPTLHATYGLLAMRTRQVTIGHLRGRGEVHTFVIGAGHEFAAAGHTLPALPAPTTNTVMLGVLQAEIRTRSMNMATNLSRQGVEILHIHADGIHVAGNLPLIDDRWRIEERTNLQYLDRVSWTSDQGDTLPGRDERERVELRRHHARLTNAIRKRRPKVATRG